MYTVLVVDDEPVALRHLCSLIERKHPEFSIIGRAENSLDALKEASELNPDILISDIRMPGMDGIALVKKVKELRPNTLIVLISGYKDFEYAKEAISIGVCDYILKPVTPSAFRQSMSVVTKKLDEYYNQQRNHLLRKFRKGEPVNSDTIHKYFFHSSYHLAIIRKNGLLRRFQHKSDFELYSAENDRLTVYGRDEQESLYICPQDLMEREQFFDKINQWAEKERKHGGYVTSIIYPRSITANELPQIMALVYQALDMHTILGISQTLTINLPESASVKQQPAKHADDMQKIQLWIHQGKHQSVLSELKHLLLKWDSQHRTELWIEQRVIEIAHEIARIENFDLTMNVDGNPYIYMLDDAFFYATTIEELIETLQYMFSRILSSDSTVSVQFDTLEFFESIGNHLKANLQQPVSIQTVCKTFGICQPYLSRLFRKYGGQSFNSYLTSLRIEYAKTLMKSSPNTYIKDIATMVGFSDPFYFSRVFRSVTGITPTEFIESLET